MIMRYLLEKIFRFEENFKHYRYTKVLIFNFVQQSCAISSWYRERRASGADLCKSASVSYRID